MITCKPLIAAISSLVWDVDRARLKRGFSGSGPGSARRVPVVAKQFRLTYDLDAALFRRMPPPSVSITVLSSLTQA